jgi:multidrug efflux pump subunit AcrA (membrane-fusion protein)
MKHSKSIRSVVFGILLLAVVFFAVRYVVIRFRPPGAMTVVEAQAMDMTVNGTPVGATPVAVEKVSRRTFAPTVTYTGSVVAYQDVAVYPRVTGTLTDVYVYPGDRVQAGQAVARLDSLELSSRSQEAEAARQAAFLEYSISSEERRQAQAQENAARARIREARSAAQEAQEQLRAAHAMREQAEREREAAQAAVADAEANVVAMQADADYWRSELERQERLYQAKALSRAEYERDRAQAQTAFTKVAQAQASVREKRAMEAAAQSKIRQAEAGIRSAQARVEQAQAAVSGAEAELRSAAANARISQQQILRRRALTEQAAAQKRTAEIVRGYTEIRAQQGGVVTERLVSPGTLVQPGMPLLRIQQIDRVRLQANVAETDLRGIRVGSPVVVTTPRDPQLRLRARITALFYSADSRTRTVTVEAQTPNPDGRLLPGQYVVMEIARETPRSALTVPLEALRRDADQKPYVWTVAVGTPEAKTEYTCVMHPEVRSDKPGTCPKCKMDLTPSRRGGKFVARRVEVRLGASDGRRVVVESGLQEGDEVIYRGHEFLQEGTAVAPTEWGVEGPRRLPDPDGETPSAPKNDAHTHGGSRNAPPSADAPPGQTVYVCPMHPHVRSDRPGTCPECKMDLEPQKPAPEHTHSPERR